MLDTNSITRALNGIGRSVQKHTPTILTVAGIVGFGVTIVLACKATPKAIAIQEELNAKEEVPSKIEVAKSVLPPYLPAIATGVISASAILAANHINIRRTAAIAGAYSILSNKHKDYVEKVKDMLGTKKEEQVRENISADYISKHPPVESRIVKTGHGDTLFLDKFSGQYFYSNADYITHVENLLNQGLLQNGSVPLSEYYRLMGFANVPSIAEYLGWDYNVDEAMVSLEKVSHYYEEGGYHITAIDPNVNLKDLYKTWY